MSWVIVDIKTKEAVFETYKKSVTLKINTEKYEVLTALEYLQSLNNNTKNKPII